jgi:hypothetical protein
MAGIWSLAVLRATTKSPAGQDERPEGGCHGRLGVGNSKARNRGRWRIVSASDGDLGEVRGVTRQKCDSDAGLSGFCNF